MKKPYKETTTSRCGTPVTLSDIALPGQEEDEGTRCFCILGVQGF